MAAASTSTVDYGSFKRARRFPALDGLRAIAVMLVMSLHAGAHSDFPIWAIVDGGKGVPIFFVLSGFLITTLLVREEEARGRVSLKAFYVRRIMRLTPLYYLVLCAYLLLIFASHTPEAMERRVEMMKKLPFFIFYMSEYATFHATVPVFGQAWSLGIEEKFYLAWPSLAFVLLARFRARLGAALGLAVILSAVAFAGVLENVVFGKSYGALFVGCALALALNDRRGFARLRFLGQRSVQTVIFVLGAVFQLLPLFKDVRETPLYSLAAAIVIGSAAIGERSIWQKVLSSRAMTYIGQRSYAIYLIHVLCTHVVDKSAVFPLHTTVGSLGAFAATLGLSLVIAELLYRFIEGPCIRLGHEWSAAIQGALPAPAQASPSPSEVGSPT
jgi:peptidoglycan/LPS O-acetylase OafA/YrhL